MKRTIQAVLTFLFLSVSAIFIGWCFDLSFAQRGLDFGTYVFTSWIFITYASMYIFCGPPL